MEFQDAVLKRRMVRNFKEDPLRDEDVRRLMDLAQHYPSAGFSQGVAYVVIRDPETKKKIGGEERMYGGRFQNFVSYAPMIILVCVSEAAYHRRYQEPDKLMPDGKEMDWPTPYWYFDAGAAAMILLLAAVDLGYAAAFSGLFPAAEIPRVRQLLGIPEEYHIVGIVSVGKPAPDVKSPSLKRGRGKFEDTVHFEHW
jgi:nitroreductase